MDPWVQVRLEAIQKAASGGPARPFWITEFGYSNFSGNSTFENPEMRTYEYGLFAADFAVEALRNRVSAALIWCFALSITATRSNRRRRFGAQGPPLGASPTLLLLVASVPLHPARQPGAGDEDRAAGSGPSQRCVTHRFGEITLLIVNRCLRDLALEVQLPAGSKSKIREFLYSRNTVPTLDRAMLRPRRFTRSHREKRSP